MFDQTRFLNIRRPPEAYNIPITNPDPGPDGAVRTADDPGTFSTYYDYPRELGGKNNEVYIIGNDLGLMETHKAVDVQLVKRISNGWQFLTAFSATKNDIPLVRSPSGNRFIPQWNPNVEINNSDRTWEWIGKISGTYVLPSQVSVSANFNHERGAPQARQVLFRGGSQIPTMVLNVEPLGSIRLPNTNIVDFRVDKSFRLPTSGHRVALRLNLYNALNASTVLSRTLRSGSAYLRPTSIVRPRIVEVGAQYHVLMAHGALIMSRSVGPILMGLMALACTVWAQIRPAKRSSRIAAAPVTAPTATAENTRAAITRAAPDLQDSQLTTLIREGLPARGMPAVSVSDAELPPLIAFVRTLRPRGGFQPYRKSFAMTNGRSLDGLVVNEGSEDAQVRSDDNRIHLLRKTDSGKFREVTSEIELGFVQRRPRRQSLHDAAADRQIEREARRAEMDLQDPERGPAAGHSGRGRRRDVRHTGERVLRARRRQWPSDLAVPASAVHRPGRRRGQRDQSRRGARRRQGFHGDRQRPPDRAESCDGCVDLGYRDGGLARESRRHVSAARRGQPRDFRHGRWRQRREGFCRGLRSGDRQRGLAFLDLAQAGRTGVGHVERHEHRAWRRQHLVHRHVRSGHRYAVLADGQSGAGLQRRRARRRQSVFRLHPRARSGHAAS